MSATIGHDPEALEAFYREHLPFVRSYVARRVDDAQTAADLTADIFVAAIESAARYQESHGPPAAWLAGIARNVVAGHHRRRARELRAVSRLSGRALLDDASTHRINERLDAERATRQLYRSLSALPAKQREVVELVAIDGLSLTEAAKRLGITAGNARVRYHRARAAMALSLPELIPTEVI
ncbi:MAG: RNA polymerase sigma factor [Nocardioides sp.]